MVLLLLLPMPILIYALGTIIIFLMLILISIMWLSPTILKLKLERNGFTGPSPAFPFGNLIEMRRKNTSSSIYSSQEKWIFHDIHASVFPYFARWTKSFGKVFIYWLGTEPFLYIADPEFLKQISSGVLGKKWGKPNMFKYDRKPLFGEGLLMAEGDEWNLHRNIISPAFSMTNLNTMISSMEESTNKMLNHWLEHLMSGQNEIDIDKDVTENAAEIIAKTSFGIEEENGKRIFEKLRTMQTMLFKTNRLVGVPLSKFFNPMKTYTTWKLGKEIDELLLSVIESRKQRGCQERNDLLGFLIAGNEQNALLERRLTTRELVDECKTFFFGGHETTALALSWTLLMLALHPDWQSTLRAEVMEASEGRELTSDVLSKLIKMTWVFNEVVRLYSPAPNVQRQAREDITIGTTNKVIPNGTNMWIDVVALHHDPALWGPDVLKFRPERFADSVNGGCKHRMGYLPFGFGGRLCIGRNLTMTEVKVVLSMILRRFEFEVASTYRHEPKVMLSLRPSNGVQLVLRPL